MVVFVGSVILLGTYAYKDGIPAASDFLIQTLPDEFSEEIGKTLRDEMLSRHRLDDEKTKLLNEFTKEMGFPQRLRLYVIKSNEFNACAAPGGYIFVNSGAIDKIENHSELSALIAHEFVHVDQDHGLRSVGRSLGYDIFTAVFVSRDLREKIFEEKNQLLQLEYSREFEKEADLQALQWLEKAKIDPHGMVSLMEKMHKLGGHHYRNSNLSTHPLTIDRIEYLEEAVENIDYEFEVNEKMEDIFWELKK